MLWREWTESSTPSDEERWVREAEQPIAAAELKNGLGKRGLLGGEEGGEGVDGKEGLCLKKVGV